jgi:MFS family permease
MSSAEKIVSGPSSSPSSEHTEEGNDDPRDSVKEGGSQQTQLQQDTSKEPEFISGLPLGLVIVSISLVTFLTLLDTSIIATAIPRITDEFHSLPDVGWYGSAYQLASASLQPLTGKIYTYFRSKWCYLCFFGLFELGSLLCGTATSSRMLIVGRAVAGMGSSGIVNGGLTILASSLPLEKRAVYTGTLMGISQLGVVLGPLIGGVLTEV